jgi:sugar phosphate isomerase/epimerase
VRAVTPALAIQEHLAPGDTLAQRMAAAVAAGFDGLEVRDSDPARSPELRAAQRAGGGVIPTCCPEADGHLGDFDPARRRRSLARLQRQLDGIAELGGRGVITPAAWGMWTSRLPPFDPPPRTPAEDREVLVEQLAALGAHAERAGVLVLFEPLNRYEDHMVNTLAQAAEIVHATGSRAVRVLADTYHMNIEEDDLCAALRDAAPVLGAVHLSDSNRHQPGTGHFPFGDVLATLGEVDFGGTLSVECRVRGELGPALTACGAFLRGLLASWD